MGTASPGKNLFSLRYRAALAVTKRGENEEMKSAIEHLKEYKLYDISHLIGLSVGYSELLCKAIEENTTVEELINFIIEKQHEVFKCVQEF